MTNAGELHQIAIPDGILRQHNEVISLLFFRLRIINRTIDDIHLVANNWLEIGSLTKFEQLNRAIHHTVIGESDSGHAQLLRPFHHRRQLRRPVEQAVVAVVMEGNKCHGPRLGPNARSSVSLHNQPPHLALFKAPKRPAGVGTTHQPLVRIGGQPATNALHRAHCRSTARQWAAPSD